MKRLLKKIGRYFIVLNEIYEGDLRQSVLLVDGSFILPNNFALIIRSVQKKFKNARLVVLTFQDKKDFIRDNFPDVEIVVSDEKIGENKHQLAIQLFFLLRKRFNFIILSSLDISLVLTSVIFGVCPIFLHNKWMEWYRIRQRTISDILRRTKSADRNRRRLNRGLKDILKSAGRVFLILSDLDEEDIKSRILIEDNGYTEIGHVITAVRIAEKIFINSEIVILTFERRKSYFVNNFPQIKLVAVRDTTNRYELAWEMYRLRNQRFNYIILTTLDVSPLLISLLLMKAKVLLYNRWHQWWSLSFMNILEYLKEILRFLIMIPIYIYLLFMSSLILLRTGFRLGLTKFSYKSKK